MDKLLKPPLTRTPDFTDFWQGTLGDLGRVPLDITQKPVSQTSHADLVLEDITFCSLDGGRIEGYLLRGSRVKDERNRPLVIHSHGYTSTCEIKWAWAEMGLDVVGVNIRGFRGSKAALPELSPWGYVLSGMDTPQNTPQDCVLRGAVCDYIRAVETGLELVGGNPARTVFYGSSFSGGLAFMAAALMQTADFLSVRVPTFGWAAGRRKLVRAGSGHEINRYLDRYPQQIERVMSILSYFDPMNFAGQVTCPTVVGVGLKDHIVPAETVYSIINHLDTPFEVLEYPVSHSDLPEEILWNDFETHWLNLACQDVPPEFGLTQA
jgi:cephalosporin-C deacetylase